MNVLNCLHVKTNTRGGCYYWTWSDKIRSLSCGKLRKLRECKYKTPAKMEVRKHATRN